MATRRVPVSVDIEAGVTGVRTIQQLTRELRTMREQGQRPIKDPTRQLREGAKLTTEAFRDMRNQLAAALSVGALTRFATQAVRAFAELETSMQGLASVAQATGIGTREAFDLAKELEETSKGLITFEQAVKSVQNLLQGGASIEQARDTIIAFADASVVARASHLSLGEAIVEGTEALRLGSSERLDNAGITKNVSDLEAEYAEQIGKTTDELTEYEKQQARLIGVQKQAAIFSGQLANAANLQASEFDRARNAARQFAQVMGSVLAPSVTAVLQAGTTFLQEWVRPAIALLQELTAIALGTAEAIGATVQAILSGDLSGLADRIEEIRQRVAATRSQIQDDLLAGAAAQVQIATAPADAARRERFISTLGTAGEASADSVEQTDRRTRSRRRENEEREKGVQLTREQLAQARALGRYWQERESARALNELGPPVEEATQAFDTLAQRLEGDVGSAIEGFFADIASGSQSAADSFRSFAQSILSSVQRILAQNIAQKLTSSLFGSQGSGGGGGLFGGGGGGGGGAGNFGGFLQRILGGFGFAEGGHVTGPGTSTSDSIPARLSAGEYVLRASAVQALGVGLLDGLNAARAGVLGPSPLRFAEGGQVPAVQAAAPVNVGTRVVNVLDPNLAADYLESSSGERTILNIIERNRGAVRQSLQ